MRALVTGVAGFIGSHLADALLSAGADVLGVDAFIPYYDPERKRDQVASLRRHPRFRFEEADLRTADLTPLVAEVDTVFHHAAQPGVRASWGDGFDAYLDHNLRATQRLLEAVRAATIQRFVFASSSSVYGENPVSPVDEQSPVQPFSPYGVTKLAAEQMCVLYAQNWGVPTVCLRYFTVYGPRQRPDMAAYRLIAAAGGGAPFPMFGDGSQVRDFTFVGDVVAANLAAARQPVPPGTVMNISGGSSTSLSELIDIVGRSVGREVPIDRQPSEAGDVSRTEADNGLARRLLGWRPVVSLEEGIRRQVRWQQSLDSPGQAAATRSRR